MDAPQHGDRLAGSLRSRLLLGTFAASVPLLAGVAIWMVLLAHTSVEYRQLTHEVADESAESVALMRDLNDASDHGSRYIRTGYPEDLRMFRVTAVEVDRALRVGAGSFDAPEEIFAFRSIREPWEAAKQRIAALRPGRDLPGSADLAYLFQTHMRTAGSGLERLLSGSQREVDGDLAGAQQEARSKWLIGLGAALAALLITGLLANRLSKSLMRPLEQLARAARTLAAGQLDHRVEINSTSELNEVGGTFNAMAEALEKQRDELERHAFADALTGLANRALFEDRARQALERAAGGEQRVAVLVVDIDGFKLVNDGLGHSLGDALLQHAAERMLQVVRPADTLARIGSDEFAVLIEDARGLDDALGVAERLRRALVEPFLLAGNEVLVTASVGIALSSEAASDAAELLRRADLAMYRVKTRGRNGYEFFDPAMDDSAAARLETLNALRRAVDRNELVVRYQPIIDLDTGEVRAAEALMRWNRPQVGLVPPLEFIPLAEETGLIVGLGAWVLQEACAEAQRWTSHGALNVPVTVNVSARQLIDPCFETTVADALGHSGLEPRCLILEVTESSVMHNADVTIPKLERISATGVRIALDDFGEGYSSLGQLRELPIDILKIARPFVRELTQDGTDPALVRGIIELAHSLGLRLVAEGIEEPEQQALLRAFGCSFGQGFLFARPLEVGALNELFETAAAVRSA